MIVLYGKYKFFCSLETAAVLPFYKGSTFRGVFGRALKQVVCALKKQECAQCLLKQKCIYALVFETSTALKAPAGSRIAAPPHPFVIEPPLTIATEFPKGAPFDFSLLLFGETNSNLPYFIYAFEQMGKIGIGKKVNGRRGRFTLKEVRCGEQIIYSESNRELQAPDATLILPCFDSNKVPEDPFSLKLTLQTPMRLKFKNRLNADLPFHVLVRAMLRRISSLLNSYGDGEPPLDYRGLVQRAETVRVSYTELAWFDWRRYSHRQDKSMLMGGLTGAITFKGNLKEYMPLVEFCSKVHIGKQTSFGLGKIKATIIQ